MATEKKVQLTMNVKQFKFHPVNRITDNPRSRSRIKEIAESMKKDGLLLHPIVVTSQFWIVDGQHRVLAALQAGKGIYFIVDHTIPNTAKAIFEAAHKFNSTAKTWDRHDYTHGFVELGNESYKILDDFGKKYPMFSMTERMMMLRQTSNDVDLAKFKKGEFKVTNLKKGEELAEKFLELKPVFEKGYNSTRFVRVILSIIERKKGFSFDEFIRKAKLRPGNLFRCNDMQSYSVMINNIYNYRRGVEDKIDLRLL